MRKDALLKALSDPDNGFTQQEPPGWAVFFFMMTRCPNAVRLFGT